MKMELRRLIFDEQVRGEKRKAGGSLIEATGTGTLKPWREVVTPHADVASGDPVVQLQTNFGGGKTHSMLALYHLFSGANAGELAGVEAVLAEAGVKGLPAA